MFNAIIAQSESGFLMDRIIGYALIFWVIFFIHLYIFRAIFNIPSFLKYQKAQIRLLEEIAKTQGANSATVKNIISESLGWDGSDVHSASSANTAQ
jgi:uncharacterized membrane protein